MMLELPYPPSVNHYYRSVVRKKNGKPYVRMLLGDAGEKYRDMVSLICAAMKVNTFKERLEVDILLYPPDKRKRDVDNTLKCILDSLEHGHLYENDNQIDDL